MYCSLIRPIDCKYFIPMIKKVQTKRHNIICRSCKKKLKLDEEYIWFYTHSREIFKYFGLRSTAKAPNLIICLCINCWLEKRDKLIELAGVGYKILNIEDEIE